MSAKYIITIEEIAEDKGILAKVLLWVFVLWWVYLTYFLFVLPVILMVKAINNDSNDAETIAGKILLWIFVLWWIYLLYYMFVFPAKLIISGIKEHSTNNIIIGSVIYVVVIIIMICSIITSIKEANRLKFNGLDDKITVFYGDQFDYLNGIGLQKEKKNVDGTITYEGNVDTFSLGNYKVIYKGVFEEEIISKEVTVTVVPFYQDQKITVLQKFTITKLAEGSYTVSGILVNNSGRDLIKVTIDYYCVDIDTIFKINFNSGMLQGEQSFSVVLNSSTRLDECEFIIKTIISY